MPTKPPQRTVCHVVNVLSRVFGIISVFVLRGNFFSIHMHLNLIRRTRKYTL